MKDLTQERLKEILDYDAETGIFTWKSKASGRAAKGSVAGTVLKVKEKKYITIGIAGKKYYAHRLAFFWMNGYWPIEIDHEDQDSLNNIWTNIREVTSEENSKNAKLSKASTTGVTGVNWNSQAKKWVAVICSKGKHHYLGCFENIHYAVAARKEAELLHGFHPNHGRPF